MSQSRSTKKLSTLRILTQASRSINTHRAYESDVKQFKKCGGSIPATPKQITNFLVAQYERDLSVSTIERRLCAIHWAHLEKNKRSPVYDSVVRATLAGIRRIKGSTQNQKMPLMATDLLKLLPKPSAKDTVRTVRDRALLLVGFAGAFRRSELAGLTVEDLNRCHDGLEVCLHRTKTDQVGKGRVVFLPTARGRQCPVRALREWLKLTGIKEGPIFRSVSKSGSIGSSALTGQSVAMVLKAAVRRVSGNQAAASMSGHSMRSGFCTSAHMAGVAHWQIRAQTGHTTDAMLARYIRPVEKRAKVNLL